MRPGAGSSAPLRRSSGRPWLSSGTREARTVAAAVARVLADTPELGREQVTEPDSPTRFGDSTTFYRCSVAALSRRMAPGTVDLIAAFPPAHARLATFSDLAALATRALTREWVMMVAVIDTDRLPEMLARMRRYGPEWIMEFSLLFTTPVATSGEPHRIALRRVALLVYGKPGARLSGKEDVIEVRAPGSDAEGRALGLEDGMAPVVRRFASQGQVVCDHMVGGRSRVVLAAIRGGCTFIGADENQWRIYRVLEQLAGAVTESPPPDQERPERWCSFRPTAGYTQHPVPSVPGRGIRRVSPTPVVGLPPPLPTRQTGGRPRTAGGPPGEAAPSIRGADPVLAGTAVRTQGPKRGPAVFHGHALDVPRRSLRPALQAVNFDSVRRCGHGQLLHRLASIQLWPARLRRSRTLFRSIVALKAQVARPGGDIPGKSRVPFPCGLWTTRTS